MNLKSIILGSAASLLAVGAVQAADLPVAEPIDYVKVCDAYGKGYFVVPGTDTCLQISGYVRAEARAYSRERRTQDKTQIWARGQVNFTAREETELGTLSSRVRIEGESNGSIGVKKAWIGLGGFFAGYVTSASVVDYVGGMYGGDFDLGDTTVGTIGYHAALGNGVTASLAIENTKHTGDDPTTSGTSWAWSDHASIRCASESQAGLG